MTIPTYLGLQTALSGLEAAQAAIDTAGQNISNASTPGYTEEQVNLTENGSLTIPSSTGNNAELGTGVSVEDITRVRDSFLDSQYRSQNSQTSADNTDVTYLTQAQSALGETNSSSGSTSGLSTVLNQFFQDFDTLSTDPTNQGDMQAVIDDGQSVASSLNTLAGSITGLQSEVTQQYDTLTNTSTGAVANDANEIAQLNGQIAQAQAAGINDDTLEDQRDNAIDDLSQYSNVYVTTQSNGMVNVSFGNAATAAQNGTTDSTPLVDGSTVNLTQNLTDSNLSGSSGTLGALLGQYDSTTGDGTLTNYLNSLNGVASSLVSTVNNAISTADAAGATAPAFFDPTGTTAATIAVNSSLSASTTSYTEAEATAVSNLSGGSAQQSYDSFVTQVGGDVQSAQDAQTTAQSVLSAISNQRQSVSGVSLDEEMTNLVQYQQAYQASARVMSTIDDTFDSLLQMVSG
ncbi:MAG TPA: flagellar hook-associated protein FlgK [Solirubrobacteraceae bacterium]|nr:flagellar hook-associated protein FlgK [Solirubrobacteraceae bacterium]